jgi:hypothetical protein
MLMERYILIIGVSIIALVISAVLDKMLSFMPRSLRFLIQLPVLVMIIDEIRVWVKERAPTFDLHPQYVDGAFFFAAPLTAVASRYLIRDVRSFVSLF